MILLKIEEFENTLIEKFENSAFFKKIENLGMEKLCHVLLQRRFLSYAFTPIYDFAIDGITEREAKKIARRVLREEYPNKNGTEPSHREDLFEDLLALGLTRIEILSSEPTKETMDTIQETFIYLRQLSIEEHHDICLLIFLRFWGELLVGLEYEQYWKSLQKIYESQNYKSKFYKVHLDHDVKKTPLHKNLSTAMTHSDKISHHLIHLINRCDEFKFEQFQNIEKNIFTLKTKFYKQFKF